MKKIRLFSVLSFLLVLALGNVYGQHNNSKDVAYSTDPEEVATNATSNLVHMFKLDSLTAKKAYRCYLVYYTEYTVKTKEMKDPNAKGRQFDQFIMKLDTCFKEILTKTQWETWRAHPEGGNGPHERSILK
ncbi:MAG TPA: hypothetical protein VIH57_25900 [Bacteroidales bacterium]